MDFPLRTGFSNLNEPNTNFLETLTSLLIKFSEKSIIYGAHYAKCAGRENLSGMDTIYALQYLAHEFHNLNTSTNESDSDSESESDYEQEINDDDDVFSRAPDVDETCILMNHYHDTWDSWEPTNELQMCLKRNIDKTIEKYNIA